MAKTSAVERNKNRTKLAKKWAGRRERLKTIANDEQRPLEERFLARLKLAEVPRNASPVRQRNRCELTGRPRGTDRKFKWSDRKSVGEEKGVSVRVRLGGGGGH